jgi:hypothetical protein
MFRTHDDVGAALTPTEDAVLDVCQNSSFPFPLRGDRTSAGHLHALLRNVTLAMVSRSFDVGEVRVGKGFVSCSSSGVTTIPTVDRIVTSSLLKNMAARERGTCLVSVGAVAYGCNPTRPIGD